MGKLEKPKKMKKKTLTAAATLIILSAMASAAVVVSPIFVQGGTQNNGKYAIVCGPPVYDYFRGCTDLNISIHYPTNGTRLYLPHITPNFTYTTNTPGDCYYRIVGYSWNNLTCTPGNNSQRITLPAGRPITVEFNLTAGDCSTTDKIDLYVYYFQPHGSKDLLWPIIAAFTLTILLIEENRRPKSR